MEKEHDMLTVMIPTYNRKDCLIRVLECLKNQTCQRFNILISDNGSGYDVKETVSEYSTYFGERLKLFVRSVNVGAIANINGAFALADTKWGWLLGDDDFPVKDAVEMIYSYLDDEVAAVHFSIYDLSKFIDKSTVISDIEEFIDLFWKMTNGKNEVVNLQGDLIFMSNKVFDLDVMKKFLFVQNTYGYTRVAPVVSILKMLEQKKGRFRIVQKRLVEISDTDNQSWKMTNIALGMTTFSHIDFKISPQKKKKLNLIVMFKYTHVLRYRLQGEISRYNIGLIYDGIYKRSLGFKDRMIFNIIMRLNPQGLFAKKIVAHKNRNIRIPQ